MSRGAYFRSANDNTTTQANDTMSDNGSSTGINRRRIKLETRFGSARQSRSRKDRPCDLCRNRKSACVISVKPPCRLCETRGLECTFASEPIRRAHSTKSSSSVAEDAAAIDNTPIDETAEELSDRPQLPPAPSIQPQLPAIHSASRSYLPFTPETPSQSTSTGEVLTDLSQSPEFSSTFTSPQRIYYPSPKSVDTALAATASEYTLEDGENKTAHFIGLSGEQDTDLLASIRYNVCNETRFVDFHIHKVFSGDSTHQSPPIHFYMLNDKFPERDQKAKRHASDAIERHVNGHGDALLRLYFRFVHPMFPILSKARTLRSYASDKLSLPASLRGAIYGLGCAYWDQDETLKGRTRITQPELFEYAHAALNRELDSPKLSTLQACLLVIHEQPDVTGTTESPKVWTYACQATACAQSLGLHQDPSYWKIEAWEKCLRKKLWWAVYYTDKWSSLNHGNPSHILPDSFDTSELRYEDLACDEDVIGLPGWSLIEARDRSYKAHDAARFLESIKLSRILDNLLDNSFTLQAYCQTLRKSDQDRLLTAERYHIQINDRLSMLPRSLVMDYSPVEKENMNGALHVTFFAVRFMVLRALMAPATATSKADPTSRLCQKFQLGLQEGQRFVEFMSGVRTMDVRVFWSRHSRTNLVICANFLIYLFFGASTAVQVKEAYDMLQRFHTDLRFLADVADWSTIGLVRPALLRVESFFQSAAEGIRVAGND
ncbi:hypothetical protein PVAG01_04443 [Phlyctema vagabunda]|uniref:Zn(2)-C6 fungal-type domain-containing protein n=1 Tax=Phlyctema vagabunda TaxID=108571 RepID=A0ABR4PPA3_9HELO